MGVALGEQDRGAGDIKEVLAEGLLALIHSLHLPVSGPGEDGLACYVKVGFLDDVDVFVIGPADGGVCVLRGHRAAFRIKPCFLCVPATLPDAANLVETGGREDREGGGIQVVLADDMSVCVIVPAEGGIAGRSGNGIHPGIQGGLRQHMLCIVEGAGGGGEGLAAPVLPLFQNDVPHDVRGIADLGIPLGCLGREVRGVVVDRRVGAGCVVECPRVGPGLAGEVHHAAICIGVACHGRLAVRTILILHHGIPVRQHGRAAKVVKVAL